MKNKWTTPNDIRALILKRWQSQKLLKAWLAGTLSFPYVVSLSKPKHQELSNHFSEVKSWIKKLHEHSSDNKKMSYSIQWQQYNLRSLGQQKLPQQVTFESDIALFGFIEKLEEFRRFQNLCNTILARWPNLRETLSKRPFSLLALSASWHKVIAVLDYFEQNSKPNLYLRQLAISEVDSKFIEQNRAVINDLLMAALPKKHFDQSVSGLAHHGFERRFGIRSPQPLIRFRILDQQLYQNGLSDLTIPLDQFQSLSIPVKRVFITENKINGLAFPDQPDSIVIFGLGYGIQSLSSCNWLDDSKLYYWGDIDTHGFNILNQLRNRFPNTQSILMDETTLLACKAFWGEESEQINIDLNWLTAEEQHLYRGLLNFQWQQKLRLEQERIPYNLLQQALLAIG